MTLARIAEILSAETLAGENLEGVDVASACGSDLMSDVLCFSKSRSLLLTGLTNPQVVRTAEMSEVAAVCFVRGKRPPEETMELARKNRIPLLLTERSMYSACGMLWAEGLQGCDDQC
jgi:predicted transcriptional regulator